MLLCGGMQIGQWTCQGPAARVNPCIDQGAHGRVSGWCVPHSLANQPGRNPRVLKKEAEGYYGMYLGTVAYSRCSHLGMTKGRPLTEPYRCHKYIN